MINYDKYDEILRNQIWSSIFVIILILILGITLFLLNTKHFFDDLGKIGKYVVNIFVTVVVLSAFIYFSLTIYCLYVDIDEQSYITYVGVFEVSSFKEGYVTLKDDETSLTLSGKVDLPGGTYTGEVVYAKHSKRVLNWTVLP